ncbi:MAG: transcriptional regulator [Terracidiphilus sp.]
MNRLRIDLDLPRIFKLLAQVSLLVLFLPALSGRAAPALWNTVGPAGGDARAFAVDPGHPDHLYLGSTNSWIYESVNGGASWRRLAKLDSADDLVLDHIVVDHADPSTIYVAAWKLNHPGGGLWVSHDAGRSWSAVAGLRGQSIRAFAQAPSNPSVLVAGTLEGVFRSTDSGASWKLISPPGSHEIHEVESLAIDPVDSEVVYAGTWHLPWKTTDGGRSWRNIKQGIIDDSDVFSIIIDPERPTVVYASACSGIYKSEDGGRLFRKIEGIPATARRTRVLRQDPDNRNVLYAGTTEGLYKSVNGGKSFERMTGPDVIVNDVFVDPRNPRHVLLATDRGGVLMSNDGGVRFAPSNEGFSARNVQALIVDRSDPARLFAGVINDKSYGGVFVSNDDGRHWRQISSGLDGRDVFALAESPQGAILAGTNDGIFALDSVMPRRLAGAEKPGALSRGRKSARSRRRSAPLRQESAARAFAATAPDAIWVPRNTIQNTRVKTSAETVYGVRVHVAKQVKEQAAVLSGRVYALDLSTKVWLASAAGGLFTSSNGGASWQGGPVMGAENYLSVAAHGLQMVAARPDGVVLSTNAGQNWMPLDLPVMLTEIHCVAFSADGTLWLGTRQGVFFTRNQGGQWMWLQRLPLGDVDGLHYDPHLNRLLVSSRFNDEIYLVDPKSLSWKWTETGYRIHLVRASEGRLMAASLDNGVLMEPRTEAEEASSQPFTEW